MQVELFSQSLSSQSSGFISQCWPSKPGGHAQLHTQKHTKCVLLPSNRARSENSSSVPLKFSYERSSKKNYWICSLVYILTSFSFRDSTSCLIKFQHVAAIPAAHILPVNLFSAIKIRENQSSLSNTAFWFMSSLFPDGRCFINKYQSKFLRLLLSITVKEKKTLKQNTHLELKGRKNKTEPKTLR